MEEEELLIFVCKTFTQQQRPESPTVTRTWHARYTRYINSTRGYLSFLSQTKRGEGGRDGSQHAFVDCSFQSVFIPQSVKGKGGS